MAAQTSQWSEDDIPDQHGRTVLITGANSGLGLRTAQVLAAKGARVLLACRSTERGRDAMQAVRADATGEPPELVRLDLADLESVRHAAQTARKLTDDRLDVLVNNAGVMGAARGVTVDGFEIQFGTNHLGHAALTWLLMPALRGGDTARVVTVSSLAAQRGQIDLADPNFERRRYNPAAAYGQAKLANQVFAVELDRRLRAEGVEVRSLAAHPGFTATGLGPTMARARTNPLVRWIVTGGNKLLELALAQDVRSGALPQLFAATAPQADGGLYIGPDGFAGMRGHPRIGVPLGAALHARLGEQLWSLTAQLTGVAPNPA
jgi:NAD(P)-dependent dehydrogenase (short-subunit alcohol dehydrogenase family)